VLLHHLLGARPYLPIGEWHHSDRPSPTVDLRDRQLAIDRPALAGRLSESLQVIVFEKANKRYRLGFGRGRSDKLAQVIPPAQ
jgi:hypothetical protein